MLRYTRKRRTRKEKDMGLVSMLLAGLLGAMMMWFMDPKTGKDRREEARGQAEKLRSKLNQYTEKVVDEASDTARETAEKVRNTAEKTRKTTENVRDNADEMLERLQQDTKE
jgi:gas vesicle protein